uniref:ATP synthase F0 subunit 8 n=1 Tax=Auritibicen japonicus TaxID=1761006 RepID=A0A344ALC7_9HEMI|nr:ATP synthase F0 subunit 8 [Auritibicen japonicus]
MPQMSPMYWLILMFFFISMLMLMIMFIYFIIYKKPNYRFINFVENKMNWLW